MAESKRSPASAQSNGAGGKTQARVYKNTRTVQHDLFKLLPAVMRKNVSFREDQPEMIPIEHCHIFHTVDSSGRPQDKTNSVGGHHHLVEVVGGEDGVPVIKVSAPHVFRRVKVKGKMEVRSVPLEERDQNNEVDAHSHEAVYLGSEEIQLRKSNVEFAKFHAAIMAKQVASVPGVQGE